jgi:hypothetical protein
MSLPDRALYRRREVSPAVPHPPPIAVVQRPRPMALTVVAAARSSRSASAGGGAATGTYKVTGYTLELDCSNGQVQRFLAFYPFPGKPQIFVGNVTFSVE